MLNAIKTFSNDESGAVTVDWVVLTAALVGLGLAVMAVVSNGIGNVTAQINDTLQTNHLATSAAQFDLGLGGAGGTTSGGGSTTTP